MAPITRSSTLIDRLRQARLKQEEKERQLVTEHRLRPKNAELSIRKVATGRVQKPAQKAKTATKQKPFKRPVQTGNLLLKLPAEIRNQIYELALTHPATDCAPIKIRYKHIPWREPGLLSVCQQIRNESLPVYYTCNKFHILLNSTLVDRMVDWLAAITKYHTTRPELNLNFTLVGPSWHNLDKLRYMVEFMRETGFTIPIDSSIFTNGWNGSLQDTFKETLAMGREAFEEKWSTEYLELEYAMQVEESLQCSAAKQAGRHLRAKQRDKRNLKKYSLVRKDE